MKRLRPVERDSGHHGAGTACPSYEVWAWAGFLVVAALIYVGFAAFNGASKQWTWTELGGVAGYGLIALHPGFVPSWYPPLCLGFDVYVGVVLVVRFRGLAVAARA